MSKTARAGSRRPIVRPEEHTLDTLIHDCTGGDLERLRREFRRVDVDGRGKLTEARFKAALRNAGLSAPGHILDRAVGRAMDYSAGLVDYERFISAHSSQARPSAPSKQTSMNSRLYDDAYAATELQTTSDAIARKVAAAMGQPEPPPAGLTSLQLSQHPQQRLENTVPMSEADSVPSLSVPRAARTAQKVVVSKLSSRGPPSKVFRTVFDQHRRGTLEYGEFLTGIRRAGIPSDQVTDHECELLFKATAEHGRLTIRGFDSLFTLGTSEDTVATDSGKLKRPYDQEPNEIYEVQNRIARSTRDPNHDLILLQQRESPSECPVEEFTPQKASESISSATAQPDTVALATALRRKLQQAIATKYSSQQAAATAASEVDSLTGRRQLTQESMTRFLRRMLPNATERQIQLVIEQVQNAGPANERGEYALFREDPDTTYHSRADERVLSQAADATENDKPTEVINQSYIRDKRGRCRSVDNITAVMNTEANKNYKDKLFTEKAAPEGVPHRNSSTVTDTFELADYPASVQPNDFTGLDTSAIKKRRAATTRRTNYNRSVSTGISQEPTNSSILEIRRALLRDSRGGRTLARGLQEVANRASDAYDFHTMLQDYVPNDLDDGQVKALIKCGLDPLTSRVDSERLLSTLNLTVEGKHSPTVQTPMRCGDESGDFFHTTIARSQLRPSSAAAPNKSRSQTSRMLTQSTVGEQLAPPTEDDYQVAFSRRPRSTRTMDSSGVQTQLLSGPGPAPNTDTTPHSEPRKRDLNSSTTSLFRGGATTRPISRRSSSGVTTTTNSKGDLFGASVSDAYADFGPRRRSASICQDSSGIWETFGVIKTTE
ncbi:hypothetical protein GMRT_10504 [Giardia muris]|uniref:EF-hand domain-containing protein n=1 Tax=Giardia muris TaxID=5742 RepID=A0A4Z1SNP2_GIAMU|nr:hypothetical protein GMRT_10504 [Giardia muris]|eukprot:TNJ26505.1 hypothetical protein GMRT_10504 [Giardia muris]